MGKFGRGALWFLAPPLGAVVSARAGRRKDVRRLEARIDQLQPKPAPVAPAPDRGGEIDARLRAEGFKGSELRKARRQVEEMTGPRGGMSVINAVGDVSRAARQRRRLSE